MASVFVSLLFFALRSVARSRAALHVEILAPRYQMAVLNRSRPSRLRLTAPENLRVVPLPPAGDNSTRKVETEDEVEGR